MHDDQFSLAIRKGSSSASQKWDPPLKRHIAATRNGQRVAVPGGLGSVGGQAAGSAVVGGELFEVAVERLDGLTPTASAQAQHKTAVESPQRPVSPCAPVAQVDRAAVS